jgi:hypothetical protein
VPSRPGQSKALLDELLASHDSVAVEAAIARLAIIGRPALRHVLARVGQSDVAHQPRLLRVLERIGDPSALSTIRPLMQHTAQDVALAAIDAMGALLDARDGAVASAALDALTATLLDAARDEAVRLRAFETIAGAPGRTPTYEAEVIAPLREQLSRDRSAIIREAVGVGPSSGAPAGEINGPSGEAQLENMAAGDLPADPEVLRLLLGAHGASVPLTMLHRVIERVRAHESTVAPADAEAWRVVRATAHLALAARGSRLAVYDLREALAVLEAQTPVGMLSALQQVGDASVLDVLADAWQGSTDTWFRGQLVTIFRAVVERERITKRHAAVKKLAARAPDTLAALWG